MKVQNRKNVDHSNKRSKTAKKRRKFSERFDIQLKTYITQIKGSKQKKTEHSNERSKKAKKKRREFRERYEILQT